MSPKDRKHPRYVEDADLPNIEVPQEEEPVSSTSSAHDLNDEELSKNISYYSSLEAECRQTEGDWKKTEALLTQEVSQKESEKYLEYMDQENPNNPGKAKTVKYVEAQVAVDPEVVTLRKRLAKSKGQGQAWRGHAEAYAIKKMDYLSERKHRRESSVYDPERMSERIPG